MIYTARIIDFAVNATPAMAIYLNEFHNQTNQNDHQDQLSASPAASAGFRGAHAAAGGASDEAHGATSRGQCWCGVPAN